MAGLKPKGSRCHYLAIKSPRIKILPSNKNRLSQDCEPQLEIQFMNINEPNLHNYGCDQKMKFFVSGKMLYLIIPSGRYCFPDRGSYLLF